MLLPVMSSSFLCLACGLLPAQANVLLLLLVFSKDGLLCVSLSAFLVLSSASDWLYSGSIVAGLLGVLVSLLWPSERTGVAMDSRCPIGAEVAVSGLLFCSFTG